MESHKVGGYTGCPVRISLAALLTNSDVCDALLLDKSVPEKKRQARAEAILMIGHIFRAARRDAAQSDTDEYVFEQLLASSQRKKKGKKNEESSENPNKAQG